MIGVAGGAAIAFLTGYAVVRRLLPPHDDFPRFEWGILRFTLAAGLGIGAMSLVSFLTLLVWGTPRSIAADVVVAGISGIVLVLSHRKWNGPARPFLDQRTGEDARATAALPVCLGAIGLATGWFAIFTWGRLHGDWDAWAIWNLRAKFLVSGDWKAGFDPALIWSHPEYPLFLPLAVARLWVGEGGITPVAPVILAFAYTFGVVGVVYAGVSLLTDRRSGALAAAVALGAPYLVKTGAGQQADIPLAFFMLVGALGYVFALRNRERGSGWLAVAGFASGLAAWTKNEGMVLLVLLAPAVFLTLQPRVRSLMMFCVGALPAVLALTYFKVALAPPSALVTDLTARLHGFLDGSRYLLIAGAYARELVYLGMAVPLAVALIVLGVTEDRQRRREGSFLLVLLVLLTASHLSVYLTTPYDLAWHLGTSLNRLLIQLWPIAVLAFFLLAGTHVQAGGVGTVDRADR